MHSFACLLSVLLHVTQKRSRLTHSTTKHALPQALLMLLLNVYQESWFFKGNSV
jgi:hypothetical protein